MAQAAMRTLLAILALTAASLTLTLGFACAVPLAAFATIAALALRRAAAVAAMLAVWGANQVVGFAMLHYPTDAATIEWGVGLGAIGLLSLGVARAVFAGGRGAVRIAAGFAAAFVAYEGAVYVGCILAGDGTASFAAPVVERILVINVCAFGVLLAACGLVARAGWSAGALPRTALRAAR